MATSERKLGSNSGRASINWTEAFLRYASLPPEQRSYQAVADAFPSVSVRTVERHGRNEQWQQRARQLDQEAAQTAAIRLREERVAKLLDFERLVEATTISYANQLRDGKVRVSPSDLVRLHKLQAVLWADSDEATNSSSVEDQALPPTPIDPAERKLQVLHALKEAGALAQLLDLEPTLPELPESETAERPSPAEGDRPGEPQR